MSPNDSHPGRIFRFGGALVQIGRLDGGVHCHHHRSSFEPKIPQQLPSRTPVTLPAEYGRIRDELDAVASQRDQGAVCLLVGDRDVAGTLALHWLESKADGYNHGQLYADLGHGDDAELVSPSAVLRGWLEALGWPQTDMPDALDELSALFRTLTYRCRIAVVLENALSRAQVVPLVPSSAESLTLVTSRWLLEGLLMDGARLIDIGKADTDSLWVAR